MSWWRALREGRKLRPQTVEAVEHSERLEVGELVGTWLEAAFTAGEGAEQREAEALGRLRAQREHALTEIATTYTRAGQGHHSLRWALVYAAGQLGGRDSLAFLERVLEQEMPTERSNDIHLFSTVAEETSIRCQAVRGISSLASAGDELARASLLAQLSHPQLTVRVVACQEVRDLPGEPVLDQEIRGRLHPEEIERVPTTRRVSLEELEPLLHGVGRVNVPRPPGGESGTKFDLGAARPPKVAG
jgi:hypothetical protein